MDGFIEKNIFKHAEKFSEKKGDHSSHSMKHLEN